jgi:hypothetical protein
MKNFKKVLAVCGIVVALTGCGASFSITNSDLQTYATNNSNEYSDVSSEYESYSYVDGVYLMYNNNTQVELWDLDSTANASSWFQSNLATLEASASTKVGSSSSSGGDYSLTVSGVYYRLLFSEDKGIYAYSDNKDDLTNTLVGLGIITK